MAHALGGGVTGFSWLLLISFIFAFCTFSGKEIAGPKLAFYLLGFQVVGHFSMPSNSTDTRMNYSHLVAAFITYVALANFEIILNSLKSWALPKTFVIFSIPNLLEVTLHLNSFRIEEFRLILCFRLRAPPIFAA
jgi:hypothetical protein